ncbi:LysE family transporter [Deinococcus cellulosilyticus]|uniref:Threonine export protein RhtC n=1 Tax=Deinococcus cellulosilyticus (strain DSM 18568 / NBRC 106333 / KACC 11606 / 5516J-15) TaxID=1223518 RepID=A0A511N979_DEIC1|nr:LysE family transporter [Deinococcus cellulosilyticus]GEM49107.1 threonine export protein RhtC [Deinococcus cellulosilyticus NBRC 106333 = KACC 11606]
MTTLITLFMVHLLALLTPGPDSLLVARLAVSNTRKAGLYAALGITLGNALWAGLALIGLQVLFQEVVWLQTALKVAGGLYLLYLGFLLWKGSLKKTASSESTTEPLKSSNAAAFRSGLLTNLANVKAVIYFSSIFVTFITPGMGTGLKVSMFMLVMLETLAFFSVVALVLSLPAPQQAYQKAVKWIDRTAGTMFAAFGARLVLSIRDH